MFMMRVHPYYLIMKLSYLVREKQSHLWEYKGHGQNVRSYEKLISFLLSVVCILMQLHMLHLRM